MSINLRYESQANFSFPEDFAMASATSGVIPTFKTVSIMPGIECLAPDRTETSRGLLASPKFFPTIFSRFARETWI